MTGPLRWWIVGLVLAVAAGIGLALWRAPASVTLPAASGSARNIEPAASLPAPFVAPPTQAATQAATAPPGVTPAQWAELQHELAGRPDELARLQAYFGFADQLQRFRALPREDRGATRVALAQALDAGLDERLRRRELGVGEARLIKIAVLQVLQPDAAQQAAQMQQWEQAMAAAAPPADAAAAARDAEFQRRQAAVVAAWQARPAAERDPRQLEQQLNALRQASYGATTTTGGTR